MNTLAHLPAPTGRRKAAATAAVEAVEQLSARKSTRRNSPRKRKPAQAELPSTRPIKCGGRLPVNVVRIRLFKRRDSKFWQVDIRFRKHHKRLSTRSRNTASAHEFATLAYNNFRRTTEAARAEGVEVDIRLSNSLFNFD